MVRVYNSTFGFQLGVLTPVKPEDDMSALICLPSCVVIGMDICRSSKDTQGSDLDQYFEACKT